MGLDVDLEKLESLAVDLSTFPHATLEIKNKGESFIKRIKMPSHRVALATQSQINTEWYKILKERDERKNNT